MVAGRFGLLPGGVRSLGVDRIGPLGPEYRVFLAVVARAALDYHREGVDGMTAREFLHDPVVLSYVSLAYRVQAVAIGSRLDVRAAVRAYRITDGLEVRYHNEFELDKGGSDDE